MAEIDPKDYESTIPVNLDMLNVKRKVPRQLRPFLRGPVPIWWLAVAAELPGKALAVGLALWYRKGIIDAETVRPSWKLWKMLGIGRHAARRGLANLEAAGLVTVERKVGKNPLVTISTSPPQASEPESQLRGI